MLLIHIVHSGLSTPTPSSSILLLLLLLYIYSTNTNDDILYNHIQYTTIWRNMNLYAIYFYTMKLF